MFQRFITTKQKNTEKLLKDFSIFFFFIFCFIFSSNLKADFSKCKDKELQEKVKQVAKEEGVDSNELLSIIAHESRCNYFVIAWNLPGAPQTARNKFFESLEEAKTFAEELIFTKKYRVDVGIGQINYEANIKIKEWTLDEVLNPTTALNRVAQILKERGWAYYHSSNPTLAKKWQWSALNAFSMTLSDSEDNKIICWKKDNILKRKNSSLSPPNFSFAYLTENIGSLQFRQVGQQNNYHYEKRIIRYKNSYDMVVFLSRKDDGDEGRSPF